MEIACYNIPGQKAALRNEISGILKKQNYLKKRSRSHKLFSKKTIITILLAYKGRTNGHRNIQKTDARNAGRR